MKKALFSLFSCLFALPLFGQYDKILSDPTVSWAIEIESLLSPEAANNDWPENDSPNRSTVLKSVNTRRGQPFDDPMLLNEYLLDLARKGQLPVFADAGLREKLSSDELLGLLSRTDTIVTFDPTMNSAGRMMIIRNDLDPWDCRLVRVRQLLYYREKTAEFGLETSAAGLALNNGRVLFWFSVPLATTPTIDLEDESITWARRIRGDSTTIPVNDLKSLKRPDLPIMRVFMHRVRTDSTVEILNPSNWDHVLSVSDRANLYNRSDTVVTFDPETYEETMKIVQRNVNPEQLRLNLVEDWYWDNRRRQLMIRLFAVAPLADLYDEEGDRQGSYPLFYHKND